MKPNLIAAAPLMAVLGLSFAGPAAAQEAEDFTASLNRLSPGAAPAPPPPQAAVDTPDAPAPRPDRDAAPGTTPGAAPETAPEIVQEAEDFTARLNRVSPGAAPAPAPQAAPEPPPVEAEPEPDVAAEPEDAPEDEEGEAPPEPAPVAAADLPFRIATPPGFELTQRPSAPSFQVYQVSRDGAPFVGVYVGCCSPYPIYDGRQVQSGGRLSIVVQEDGANRAVEHLFVQEDPPRQIHVWLHSVAGADRALAERIAQSVEPR